MSQLRAYCSEAEWSEYQKLNRDTKEEINKRTRKFWAGLVKKADKKRGESK